MQFTIRQFVHGNIFIDFENYDLEMEYMQMACFIFVVTSLDVPLAYSANIKSEADEDSVLT